MKTELMLTYITLKSIDVTTEKLEKLLVYSYTQTYTHIIRVHTQNIRNKSIKIKKKNEQNLLHE
jgi:hypothetical protein